MFFYEATSTLIRAWAFQWQKFKQISTYVTWDRAQLSFSFENNIPAGKAKRKESLIQTFYETSAAHFFDWLTFAESTNQNHFRCMFCSMQIFHTWEENADSLT